MWTKKCGERCALPLLLLSCWLLPLAGGTTLQAETMYTISETELTTLETNLKTLETHSRQKAGQLTALQNQLEKASASLKTANEQLAESRRQNEATKNSLEKANQSLAEFEKEARYKIQVKARQRNLWIGISAGLLTYCIVK